MVQCLPGCDALFRMKTHHQFHQNNEILPFHLHSDQMYLYLVTSIVDPHVLETDPFLSGRIRNGTYWPTGKH